MLDTEIRVSIVDNKLVNASSGVLGDLYTSAIWIESLFGNKRVVLTASMLIDGYLYVEVGCMCFTLVWNNRLHRDHYSMYHALQLFHCHLDCYNRHDQ